MMKILLAALLALAPLSAEASNCSSNPFTFINGQTADATQVMSNFNNLLNCANNNLAHNGANSDITSLTGLSTPLATSEGGSGVAAPSANAVLLGNGASAFQTVAPSTSGNVLLSNGTTWTATPGGALVLLQTQNVNNVASVDFTSGINSTYTDYEIRFSDLLSAAGAADLWLRVSEGGIFKSGATDYAYVRYGMVSPATVSNSGSSGDTKMIITGAVDNIAADTARGAIQFSTPSSSGVTKPFAWNAAMNSGTNGGFTSHNGAGALVTNTTAIDGVRLLFSTGNVSTGVFSLYGLRKQ